MTGRRQMIIGWTALLAAWLIIFAIMEGYALTHDDAITLSRYVWEISQAWPPAVFLAGMVVGGLAVHFWWHWDPDNQSDKRG